MKAPSLATVATVFFVVTPVVGVIMTLSLACRFGMAFNVTDRSIAFTSAKGQMAPVYRGHPLM